MMVYQDPGSGSDRDDGVTGVAKEQAAQVGQTAADAGGKVAQTTKEQAQNVVGEVTQQARDLVGEARTQVSDQAGTQKGRAVQGLQAVRDELDSMAQQGGQSGLATEVTRQVSQRIGSLADHLDRHEPADLLEQVRAYARRRPVVFLAGAAVAGVLAGRLTRNLASSGSDSGPAELTGRRFADDSYPALTPGVTGTGPAYPDGGYQPAGYQPGYDQPAGSQPGLDQPGYQPAAAPAYQQPGYQQPGYQPGYEPAGYEPSTGPGGFRAPDAEVEYPPVEQPGSYPAPGTGYEPEQAPSRGWTP